jgi:thymidine phosphorylase
MSHYEYPTLVRTMRTVSQLIKEVSRLRTEEAMAPLIASAGQKPWHSEDMRYLAEVLAHSGRKLSFSTDQSAADVASTGGPSSLSTLLCPLYLRTWGFVVPKLGVPGRPAGGIDVLAQLRGYKIDLTAKEVREVIDRCGYAHFLAGAEFAPLDAALFRFRQKIGAKNIPALAVASILSKKIACGVKFAGLDVRTASHGNFGSNFAEAADAARAFCAAAAAAEVTPVAFLTDARTPYQPFIGRGESLIALREIFKKGGDAWLADHNDQCRLMTAHVAALREGAAPEGDIEDAFLDNIEAQGSSKEAFYERADLVEKMSRRDLSAERDGFIWLDLNELRAVFVDANSHGVDQSVFSDELGIILRARPGAYVRRGDLLASVRADDAVWQLVAARLTKCFSISDLLDYAPGVEEIIRA